MLPLDGYLTTYKIVSQGALGPFLDTGDESAPFRVHILVTSHDCSFTILFFIWNISISYTRQPVSHGQAFTQCCSSCLGPLPPLPG